MPPDTPPPVDPAPGWSQSLFTGACGIALLHIERARAGGGDWDTAHRWAITTTRHPVTAHPDTSGLHQGAPAVAYALHTAGSPAYAPALATLDAHITTLARVRLQRAHDRIDAGWLPTLGEYDLIRGLTGIGAYLLHRHHGGALLDDVLAYLVRLTESLRTSEGHARPGWWTANAPDDRPSPDWPGGHANLSLAHGIAGPLALLALATRAGITIPGHAVATDRINNWLDRWQAGTGTRAWWPGTIRAA
jgi:class I lanthipeptide synthase